jgi:hypothetical protein
MTNPKSIPEKTSFYYPRLADSANLKKDIISADSSYVLRRYSGRTKYSAFVSKLSQLSEPTEDAESCGFFLFEKSWAGE